MALRVASVLKVGMVTGHGARGKGHGDRGNGARCMGAGGAARMARLAGHARMRSHLVPQSKSEPRHHTQRSFSLVDVPPFGGALTIADLPACLHACRPPP